MAGKENSSLEESWGGQHGTLSERVERAEAWEANRPSSILPLILTDSVMFGLSDPPLFTCEMGTGPSPHIAVWPKQTACVRAAGGGQAQERSVLSMKRIFS